ncbi:hypothetical protein M427DRAFT_383404 [Gonapodya prolifera JEL478]|uniref:Uncharacterized protein n=1 Tax=Gonapodya prolifera (strain JEL478) TaxID=1344416 RepID=A0A139A9S9_GONPJ|nr:hypothetical protein M427DRAFT_383404 [Gonapodya prolifera JEL478]|eukprot:KXS13163.1 hypothetical protein M427DRAFT_383404 [Gonapodya prolifera JEL478]
MYDSHQLFTAAVSRYHPKFDSMSAAQFRMLLMDPISTSVTTEWACVQPPSAFVPENPKIGGDYHVLYVVKDISRDMTESTKTRMQSWLKGQMIAGSWATQMLQRGHSGAPDGAEPVSQAELRLLGM